MKRMHIYLTGCLLLIVLHELNGQTTIEEEKHYLYKKVDRETFSLAIVIKGGTSNYAKEKEGIEYMSLKWAVEGGIPEKDPSEVKMEMDSLGMQIEVESNLDYSTVVLTGLKKNWERSFEILSLMIKTPRLDDEIFEDVKEELGFYAFVNQQDPTNQIFQLSVGNLFKGSDYVKIPEGTPQSIEAFGKDIVSDYLTKLKSDMKGFLAVVGDFTNEELKIMKQFGSDIFSTEEAESPKSNHKIHQISSINNQAISTNYLRGTIISPPLSSDEGLPMLLGMEILSNRIFQKIRSEEGLSYAPQAYYGLGVIRNPYSVILIDTEKPDLVLESLIQLIKSTITTGISEKELSRQKIQHLTEKYLSQETTSLICNDLYLSGLQNLVLTTNEYNQRINSITVEEINEVFTKYLTRIYWSYLGNKELINEKSMNDASYIGIGNHLNKH
jgi:predicted Zn-dependent peptidase